MSSMNMANFFNRELDPLLIFVRAPPVFDEWRGLTWISPAIFHHLGTFPLPRSQEASLTPLQTQYNGTAPQIPSFTHLALTSSRTGLAVRLVRVWRLHHSVLLAQFRLWQGLRPEAWATQVFSAAIVLLQNYLAIGGVLFILSVLILVPYVYTDGEFPSMHRTHGSA
jgi:hypothetical protein